MSKNELREGADIANIQQENEATLTELQQEQEAKPEKPTVRPRSNQRVPPSSQAVSLDSAIIGEEGSQQASSSWSESPPVLRRPKSGPGRSRVATSKYRSGLVIENQ